MIKCITEQYHANFYFIMGCIGVFCSLKLIFGMEKKSSKKLLWWILFQWISILHQLYLSFITVNIIGKFDERKRYVQLAALSLFFYAVLEMYCFVSIIEISMEFRERENESSDQSQIRSYQYMQENKLPTYEEATMQTTV